MRLSEKLTALISPSFPRPQADKCKGVGEGARGGGGAGGGAREERSGFRDSLACLLSFTVSCLLVCHLAMLCSACFACSMR